MITNIVFEACCNIMVYYVDIIIDYVKNERTLILIVFFVNNPVIDWRLCSCFPGLKFSSFCKTVAGHLFPFLFLTEHHQYTVLGLFLCMLYRRIPNCQPTMVYPSVIPSPVFHKLKWVALYERRHQVMAQQ